MCLFFILSLNLSEYSSIFSSCFSFDFCLSSSIFSAYLRVFLSILVSLFLIFSLSVFNNNLVSCSLIICILSQFFKFIFPILIFSGPPTNSRVVPLINVSFPNFFCNYPSHLNFLNPSQVLPKFLIFSLKCFVIHSILIYYYYLPEYSRL